MVAEQPGLPGRAGVAKHSTREAVPLRCEWRRAANSFKYASLGMGRGIMRPRPFVTSAPIEARLLQRPRPEQVRRGLAGLAPRGAGGRAGAAKEARLRALRGSPRSGVRTGGRRELQARRGPFRDPAPPPAQRGTVVRLWRPLAPRTAGLGT